MKNRKVTNMRTHLGGLFGKTSYDSVKDSADMELLPIGVLIKEVGGRKCNLLVWAGNIIETHLAPEEIYPEDKRGPGRPKNIE